MHRFTLFFLALAAFTAPALGQADTRPNIVFIIADDLAWDDLGCTGNPGVRTPNLDRLAKGGMRFTNAYLTISSCSPSRASIITGTYPHQTDAEQLHWPLPADRLTFVELLKASGYWTAAAGKWHLGNAVKDRFDEIREADVSGFQLPTGEAAKAGKIVQNVTGDARSGCDQWVPLLKTRPGDKPFFLWLAALDPHRDYDEGILKQPHKPGDVRLPPYVADTPKSRLDYALYYDEITRLDRFVGGVMAELKEQNVADNTFVLFISDNGRPFPRDKTTLYDSGIKTPFIVHWPERIAPAANATAWSARLISRRRSWKWRLYQRRRFSRGTASCHCYAIRKRAFATTYLRNATGTTTRIASVLFATVALSIFAIFTTICPIHRRQTSCARWPIVK